MTELTKSSQHFTSFIIIHGFIIYNNLTRLELMIKLQER